MHKRQWRVLPPPQEPFPLQGKVPKPIDLVLYHRGITNETQLETFLAADGRLGNDPSLLPDIDKAVLRILRALLSGESIAIYGDFDVDGVTSTVLLAQGLSELGGKVIPYIPHRVKEGHGLRVEALKTLSQQGVSLVITADCGISSLAEVEEAHRMNLDIIITDHHTVPSSLPPALAVIDPKRTDSSYPFLHLSAVGVAYKVIQALCLSLGKEEKVELLDLVALGTVADIAPLLGENRYMVRRGLEVLNRTQRLGLLEVISLSGLRLGQLDTESISYALAPRLNAAGRLDHAITSYKLLTAQSLGEARPLAEELEKRNRERQRLTEKALSKAREEVLARHVEKPILLVGDRDYPAGIIGLVAGKLSEEFYRPAAVMEIGEEISRGSARSIPEFNIIAALTQCRELFLRFGGHPQAAGFLIANENIGQLELRLLEIAEDQLAKIELYPTLAIDAEIPLGALRGEIIRFINRLEPFGQGNPPPTFLTRRVAVLEQHVVGDQGKHLKLKLKSDGVIWRAIGFGLGPFSEEIRQYIDIVYNLGVDNWGENRTLELNLLDLAPAT